MLNGRKVGDTAVLYLPELGFVKASRNRNLVVTIINTSQEVVWNSML